VNDGTQTRDRLDHNTVRHSSGLRLSRRNALYGAIPTDFPPIDSSGFQGVALPLCCHLGGGPPRGSWGAERTRALLEGLALLTSLAAEEREPSHVFWAAGAPVHGEWSATWNAPRACAHGARASADWEVVDVRTRQQRPGPAL